MLIRRLIRAILNELEISLEWRRESREKRAEISTINPSELTYNPERKQKKKEQICEEIFRLWRYKKGAYSCQDTIRDYFMLGVDAEGEDVERYVFQQELDARRDGNQPSFASVMNEKDFVTRYLHCRGVAASLLLGKTDKDGFFDNSVNGLPVPFLEWFDTYNKPIFAKPINGCQGIGCFKLEKSNNTYLLNGEAIAAEELLSAIPYHLIEQYIIQHKDLAKVHPQSCNDVRIITVRVQDEIKIYGAFARFGIGNMHVDNLYSGGLFVGVKEDGYLAEKGLIVFGKQRGAYRAHPDTGICFSTYKVPMWEECCAHAKAAHREFPFLHSCGWDVTITPEGPLIIEGNEQWGSPYLQIWFEPARKELDKYFPACTR